MAKNLTVYDGADFSPLINLWATPVTQNRREWGATEYDRTLLVNNAGAKCVTTYELASFSPLLSFAAGQPTNTDMRGTSVTGGNREIGALEYLSTLSYATSPKLADRFDQAGFSQLVNYSKTSVIPFQPTNRDIRGATVKLNAKDAHNTADYYPTNTDMRATAILGGWREFGTVEYDTALRANNDTPTAGDNAQAVWDFLTASADEVGSFGLYIQDNIVPASSIADAVWDEATSGHTTTGTFGKLMSKLLTVAKFIGLK